MLVKFLLTLMSGLQRLEKILHKPGNSHNIMIYIFLPSPGMHVLLTTKKKPIAITSDRGVAVLVSRVGMKKETGMACMQWHLRTRGTNGNRLPDTDGKVPGDRWRMKIFI